MNVSKMKRTSGRGRRRFVWGLALLASWQAHASGLFDSEEALALSISGPFEELLDSNNREELPFVLSLGGEKFDVGIRTRGKSRLTVCKFPPLRLNFARRQIGGGALAGLDKVKLVTHCHDNDAAEQNLLEEFAAYRMFNVISDIGYRVRLAQITYTTPAGGVMARRAAFLIEPRKALGRRLGLVPVPRPHVAIAELDQHQAALVFVFQYLIGSTDWSLVTADLDDECCHNIDLFQRDGELVVVPYDFDLAGLVNPRHARPDPSLGISSVTRRLYRGYCLSPDAVLSALRTIMGKKTELLNVFNDTPGLDHKKADAGTKFLDRFFKQGGNEKRLLARFERSCL